MSQLIHCCIMTIAQNVRSYLRNKPYLLEALEKGIVNLSELSRQIQEELKTANTSAVKAALRRFAEEMQRQKQKREHHRIHQLLDRNHLGGGEEGQPQSLRSLIKHGKLKKALQLVTTILIII